QSCDHAKTHSDELTTIPLLSDGQDHKARLITLWSHGHDASTRHGLLSLEESRI
nr:ankyrin repeat-containing protein [Tanacetum cinerariifolium]